MESSCGIWMERFQIGNKFRVGCYKVLYQGLLYFLIDIVNFKDLEEDVTSKILKLADDTNIQKSSTTTYMGMRSWLAYCHLQ